MNNDEILMDDKDKKFVRKYWRMLSFIAAFFVVAASAGLYVPLGYLFSALFGLFIIFKAKKPPNTQLSPQQPTSPA